VTQVIASFPDLIVLVENAIHGPDRAEIVTFIEQGSKDLSGGLIHKARAVELFQHTIAL
jgi:hypothetical protein